jgi:hypothetical protein
MWGWLSGMVGRNTVSDAEVAQSMRRYAEAFVGVAAEEGGEPFGWQAGEVSRLDEVCEGFLSNDPPPEVRHSMIMALGAYLGELLVLSGGRWTYDREDRAAVVEMPNGLRCYPHNKVAKRLDDGAEHNLFNFFWYAVTREVPPGSQVREQPKDAHGRA